jgi:hypothetical protein
LAKQYSPGALALLTQFRGSLADIREAVKSGEVEGDDLTTAVLDELIGFDADEGETPQTEVAAEKKGRVVTLPTGHQLVLEGGGYALQGKHPPEVHRAVAAYLREHPVVVYGDEHTMERLVEQERYTAPVSLEDAIPGAYDLSAEQNMDALLQDGKAGRVVVYGDEGTMARLIAQEKADPPAPRRQAVKVEQVQMVAEGLPLPETTLSAEDFASAEIVRQAMRPVEFSGEYAVGGGPIPK